VNKTKEQLAALAEGVALAGADGDEEVNA